MGIFKIKDTTFYKTIQEPLRTHTVLDNLFSEKKGIMPATITMVPGKSGIGKTTLCIDILKTVKINNPDKKVLFMSVEMNEVHLFRYSKRLNFSDIPIFIFDVNKSIIEQLQDIFFESFDLILIDSFQQLVNLISVYDKISSRQAETTIIKLMDTCRLGNNRYKTNTSFLCTMHMTKSGNFAGSAYIKYMVDAMLELKKDENDEFLKYMAFTKNRDGKTNIRLYYTITQNSIEYNLSRYQTDLDTFHSIKQNEKYKEENNSDFDKIFNV